MSLWKDIIAIVNESENENDENDFDHNLGCML